MNRKWLYSIIGFAVVAAIVAAWLLLRGADDTHIDQAPHADTAPQQWGRRWTALSSATTPQLTVAVLPTTDCLPVALAYEKSWFEANGVRVNLLCLNAQMDCDTALMGTAAQVAMTDIVRAERMRKKGVPITYLTTTNTTWQLIAGKATRLTDIKQLGDKMVAMARYSATDYLTAQVTQEAKAKNTIFRVQVNDVQVRLKMLLTGAMDAAWLPEPQATAALQAGHRRLALKAYPQQPLAAISCRTEEGQPMQYAQWIEAFKKTYNQAVDSINRYGVMHYADVAEQLTRQPRKVLQKLPKQRYTHAQQPANTTFNY